MTVSVARSPTEPERTAHDAAASARSKMPRSSVPIPADDHAGADNALVSVPVAACVARGAVDFPRGAVEADTLPRTAGASRQRTRRLAVRSFGGNTLPVYGVVRSIPTSSVGAGGGTHLARDDTRLFGVVPVDVAIRLHTTSTVGP